MRIAIILTLVAGAFLAVPGAASAAPLSLSDQAAATRAVAEVSVEQVGYRAKVRRTYRRGCGWTCCTWTCRPYFRPYQYYYWQFYYPYGGPLFY